MAEALRVNARYVEEVVIGWGLCPWAARAWNEGQVTQRVFTDAEPDVEPVAAFVDELVAGRTPRSAWRSFRASPARSAPGRGSPNASARARGAFLAAAFHPDYRPPDGEALDPARLVPLIRRTPDPTLQLVRASLLENLRGQVSNDVARDNHATVTARGPAALAALLDDIRRDRDVHYGHG